MQLICNIDNPRLANKNHAVTIGNFDGVHLGHQKLLRHVAEKAHELNIQSLVIIFEPQPMEFFLKERSNSRLTTLIQKLALFKRYHIDKVLCLRFNANLASFSAKDFVEQLLIKKLNAKYIALGDNFSFGKNASGGHEILKKYPDFQVTRLDELQISGMRVSSTHIRQALDAGDLAAAEQLMGRPYSMTGHIAHGNRLGHLLGCPTANIFLFHKVVPLNGVFIVRVFGLTKKSLPAIANVGKRPSVDGTRNLLEIHILNFDEDIYGKKIRAEFIKKIRNETKFASLDALKTQIKRDVAAATQFFGEQKYEKSS